MDSKLLDETGLLEVWKKVRDRSIPVKTLRQDEYDRLEESEKLKDILYVCTNSQTTEGGGDENGESSGEVGGDTYLVKAPVGTIVIWSGSVDTIPIGWHLCDGEDGTPDLRDKFVLGAGETHKVSDAGGEENVVLTTSQIAEHRHLINVRNGQAQLSTTSNNLALAGVNSANDVVSSQYFSYAGTGDKYTVLQVMSSSGSSQPHNNMPPYYALCYIMKLTADETDGGSESGGSSGPVKWEDIQGRPDLSNLTTTVVHQIILLSSLWVDNRQTVKIDGILADELPQLIIATPIKADSYAYYSADIIPESQEDNALVFHAETVPEQDISVIVRVFETAEIREEISGTFKWWSPEMTKANAPVPFSCTGASAHPSHPLYYAFDGSKETYYISKELKSTWVEFRFGEKTYINGIRFIAPLDDPEVNAYESLPKIFTVEGSDDDEEWTVIYESNGSEYPSVQSGEVHDYVFNKVAHYKYYKITNNQNYVNDNYFAVGEIEFYKLEETT